MTVFENMSFALKQAKAPKDEIQQSVTEAERGVAMVFQSMHFILI